MCGGGFFRDSVILVSGATGTGKTLTVTQFLQGGAAKGERCLLLAFEESREQLFRNARGWGFDFEQMERDGMLRVVCDYPEVNGLEDWLITIQATVDEFKPARVALDSLSALERVGTSKAFREFVIGADVVHQARGDHGSVHVDDGVVDGRQLDHGDAHLHAHRFDHSAAVRRDVRRDEARAHGAEDARVDARQGDSRVHDRPGAACTWVGAFRTSRAFSSGSPVHLSPGDVERAWSQFEEDAAGRRRGRGSAPGDDRRAGRERRQE